MDEYNVVTLFSSDTFTAANHTGRLAAIETLKRRVRKMHARHLLASAMRALLFAGLCALGTEVIESHWGDALAVTSLFCLLHTMLFSIRGHWNISRFYQARMYWLQDGRAEQDVSPVFLRTHRPETMQETKRADAAG